MQFSETQILLSILTLATTFFLMVGFVILIVVRNYRSQLKHEAERMKLTEEIQKTERQRISENLHDELGPQVSAVKLMISSLLNLKDIDQIHGSLKLANEAMTESALIIRSIIRDVNNITNEKGGLKTALLEVTAFLGKTSGIKINLLLDKYTEHKNEQFNTHIYRILKEMIHNSIKHSNAAVVSIEMNNSGLSLIINFFDDGIGFNEEEINKGMGLSNIKKRLKLLGGTFEYISSPGKGVRYLMII